MSFLFTNISDNISEFDEHCIPSEGDRCRLQEHNYTCSGCGFISRPSKEVPSGYMYIVKNDQCENVLCRMCYAVCNLDHAVNGIAEHGFIVYAPWISQSQLINTTRIAFLAYTRGNKIYSPSADSLLSELSKLSHDLKRIASDYDGDIMGFIQICENLNNDVVTKKHVLFEGWRYVPSFLAYKSIMEYWDAASFHDLADTQWELLCQEDNNVTV